MVDLSRVVVVTGFAEIGPHGNSRTRWEMEAYGDLSLEGSIEMAWIMGLIKHHQGALKNRSEYSGWVDAQSLEPVEDVDVKARYMHAILEHSGIRLIEPEICDNSYDPERKLVMQEVVIRKDLAPFEATPEVARDFQNQHGDMVRVTKMKPGSYTVQLLAGATVMIPKATKFNRPVAGQIPKGWSAKRYGITDGIIGQVDPVTLFSLICTVEALLCSGIVDPYELYKYIHVTEVGNCIGSSMGGLSSLRAMHKDRVVEKPVQGDILQETFVNTTGAWINMLLLSSSGPIKTPVGACATSLESLDTGYDLIVAGKARVCLVGGVEDFVEDVSYEFGNMKATNDAIGEFAAGRSPREMSRPTASSRSGFVESQGCGVQILTSAKLALEMGLPIFGVVALSSMAGDKIGRSVPAPGKGILSNARESPNKFGVPSRLLDIKYRRRALMMRKERIRESLDGNLQMIEDEVSRLKWEQPDIFNEEQYRAEYVAFFESEARKQEADACFSLGNQFWKNESQIAPIRGSLATWNLGVDDLTVASLHGTSTVQNDINETAVIQAQMDHLGRREGNLLFCVCQKWLTGHSKDAAGVWMLNGCLQMLDTETIPGNRNVDNVEKKLRDYKYLLFPNKSLKSREMKAVSVTSFGFGQKGAQAILVHPRQLFATIGKDTYETYGKKRRTRWERACQYLNSAMVAENMVMAKNAPPYDVSREAATLLDPTVRFSG
jgi:fatty acid synthase subunit alpha, fungi type